MPDRMKPAAPEEAAPRVVALFVSEYIPSVKNEYAMMEMACNEPLKISLPDLQMETLVFALHCLDRAVFAFWGQAYRAPFMDLAFGSACEFLSSVLPEDTRDQFAEWFQRLCATRQIEYASLFPYADTKNNSENVLTYEFGEKMCFGAGVQNVDAIAAMIGGAQSIFVMMMQIARDL